MVAKPLIVSRLKIENLRNIRQAELEPHPSLNYFSGSNGAGKTSVLEAVSLLSRGRSFRTKQASELTGGEGRSYRVFAEGADASGTNHRLGLQRQGGNWKARLDGAVIKQLSQLSRVLPTVVMEPDSHLLVGGVPEYRRRYLDWGMFHVEPGFLDLWRNFSKALKQRNSALRRSQTDVLDSVDDVLARYGSELAEFRKRHAQKVSERMEDMLKALKTRVQSVEIRYQKGWKADSYLASLQKRRSRDLERCTTTSGPHRADLNLLCDGVPARAVLSRGEQKAFAAAMLLTQANLLSEAKRKPVLLLDDLVSEFDRDHFLTVLDKSLEGEYQVWVTGTDVPVLDAGHKMFHVEQGSIRELV